jgi:hypothetical protein
VKTFEEAAHIVFGISESGRLSAQELEQLGRVQHAFIEDILNSAIATLAPELGNRIGEAVVDETRDPSRVIPTIFIYALAYGVAIGVIMEKREE